MNEQQKLGALEAMLFANGEPVEAARLAEAMRIEPAQAEDLLRTLQAEYDNPGQRPDAAAVRGRAAGRWPPAPYYGEVVKRILDTRHNAPLSPAALEVLAVIAYNQPVSPQLYRAGARRRFFLHRLQAAGARPDRGGRAARPARQTGGFPRDRYLPACVRPGQPGRPAAAA